MNATFERPPVLAPEGCEAVRDELEGILGPSEVVFVREDDGGYLAHRGGLALRLALDEERGILRADVDTGVTIGPGREAETRALAGFLRAFRFKFCEFSCAAEGEPRAAGASWEAGARVHLVGDSLVGAWSGDELADLSLQTALEVRGPLGDVAAGRASAVEAIREMDDARVGQGFEEFLRRMRERGEGWPARPAERG